MSDEERECNTQLIELLTELGVPKEDLAEFLIREGPDGVTINSLDGKVLYASRQLLEMHACSCESDMVGHKIEEFLHPSEHERLRLSFQDMMAGKYGFGARQYRQLRKDGTSFIAEVIIKPITKNDQFIGLAAYVRDVTIRLQAEKAQKKREQKLNSTHRMESLGLLAGEMAHDFNNFLMGIIGNIELMKMDLPEGSPLLAQADEIRESASQAKELSRQMLTYSGRGKFNIRTLQFSELEQDIQDQLESLIPDNCSLEFDFHTSSTFLSVDLEQIRQVLVNLVLNAVESIGENSGTITVRSGMYKGNPASLPDSILDARLPVLEYVFLEVKDNGEGISPDIRSRIFDPFFTTRFDSRGLGLAISLGIIQGHKGAMALTSKPGAGSTFTFYLPVSIQVEEHAPTIKRVRTLHRSGTILVVDDEQMVRKVSKSMLERLNFRAVTASSAKEGIATFRKFEGRFECVLLDLTMPDKSGQEVFRTMQKIKPDIKVIVMSGYSESEMADIFSENPPVAFLNKPFSLETLKARLLELG